MKIMVTILAVSICLHAAAQQGNFLVQQVKGNVLLKNNKSKKAVKVGQLLKGKADIVVPGNAGIGLICENYRYFAIHQKGVYPLTGFSDSCIRDKASLTASYFKFIWGQLTHPHASPENNRREYMQNAGAVVRGCPGGVHVAPLLDTIYIIGNERFNIVWQTELPSGRLEFVLYDQEKEGRLLYKNQTRVHSIPMDTIKKYAPGNREMYWNITVDGSEMCARKYIQYVAFSEADLLARNTRDEMNGINDEAAICFAIGFSLEENHFIGEAVKYYEKAALLKPANILYTTTLGEFRK